MSAYLALVVLPAFQFPSWYNLGGVGAVGGAGLAGLPIPQLVQCPNQNTPCEQGVFWFGLK